MVKTLEEEGDEATITYYLSQIKDPLALLLLASARKFDSEQDRAKWIVSQLIEKRRSK